MTGRYTRHSTSSRGPGRYFGCLGRIIKGYLEVNGYTCNLVILLVVAKLQVH